MVVTVGYGGSTYGPIGPGPRAPCLGGPGIFKMQPRINKTKAKLREKKKIKVEKKRISKREREINFFIRQIVDR